MNKSTTLHYSADYMTILFDPFITYNIIFNLHFILNTKSASFIKIVITSILEALLYSCNC